MACPATDRWTSVPATADAPDDDDEDDLDDSPDLVSSHKSCAQAVARVAGNVRNTSKLGPRMLTIL